MKEIYQKLKLYFSIEGHNSALICKNILEQVKPQVCKQTFWLPPSGKIHGGARWNFTH
jgi:hypothetical protein